MSLKTKDDVEKVLKNTLRYVYLLTSGRIFELGYGGEERFTSLLAEWLVRQGLNVVLMAATFVSVKSKLLTLEELHRIRENVTYSKNARVLNPPYLIYVGSRFFLTLLWIVKIMLANFRHKIWLIHSQDTGYSGLSAVVAGKLLRIPVVLTSHGIRHKTLESSVHSHFRKFILQLEFAVDMFTVRNADMVIAVSPFIKEYFEKKSGREVEFLPTCINTNKYRYSEQGRDQIRQELGLTPEAIVIGFIGRFSIEKNLYFLIDSFGKALHTLPELRLVLVGTGLEEFELRNVVKAKGIENNVLFCGIRYDVEKVLSGFDIFVLPSFTEGLSTSLLEAMSCGRAIICSNIAANSALISHNINGILIDPRNECEIEQAIITLSQNETLRCRLGSNAKATASRYDQEIVFKNLLENYYTLRK